MHSVLLAILLVTPQPPVPDLSRLPAQEGTIFGWARAEGSREPID